MRPAATASSTTPVSGDRLPCCWRLRQPFWRRASGPPERPRLGPSTARLGPLLRVAALVLVEIVVLVALIVLAANVLIPLAAPPAAPPTPFIPPGALRDCPGLVP